MQAFQIKHLNQSFKLFDKCFKRQILTQLQLHYQGVGSLIVDSACPAVISASST